MDGMAREESRLLKHVKDKRSVNASVRACDAKKCEHCAVVEENSLKSHIKTALDDINMVV